MVIYDLFRFKLKIKTPTRGTKSMPFFLFRQDHVRSTSRIIFGSGSLSVGDHCRSGIICGALQICYRYGALSIQQKSPVQIFGIFEWNGSDRFPEFEVTCPATSRNAGWNFVVFENGGLFEHFRGLEQGDCETISCTIPDSNTTT